MGKERSRADLIDYVAKIVLKGWVVPRRYRDDFQQQARLIICDKLSRLKAGAKPSITILIADTRRRLSIWAKHEKLWCDIHQQEEAPEHIECPSESRDDLYEDPQSDKDTVGADLRADIAEALKGLTAQELAVYDCIYLQGLSVTSTRRTLRLSKAEVEAAIGSLRVKLMAKLGGYWTRERSEGPESL